MPAPVVTAQCMQQLDRRTIEEIGIPGIVLMENAGSAIFREIRRCYADCLSRGALVLCGRGNNGGDGFVIARYLHDAGVRVTALLLAESTRVAGDARIAMQVFVAGGGALREIRDETQWMQAHGDIAHAGLLVDALLGTGLTSGATGLLRRVIDDVNAAAAPVVSVDIPSGVDATSGAVPGAAVRADMTCTCGLIKRGLLVYPGATYAGRLAVLDIGIPRALIDGAGITEFLLDGESFCGLLPPRAPEAHKGNCGHVCVLAGSPGKTGAAALAAESALRAGAGMVTLGVARSLNAVLEAKLTEVMTEPLPDGGTGLLGLECFDAVTRLLRGKAVVALGPGISAGAGTEALFVRILESLELPAVVDADGLTLLARHVPVLKNRTMPLVLTPHPGEMARLMSTTVQEVQRNRVDCARHFAAEHNAHVVLKGARTLIASPAGELFINPTGNPGMASAGMGDVLTGLIAGLMAQGLGPLPAAQLGVYAHGFIGDRIAAGGAAIGMLASDIIARIPAALAELAGEGAPAGAGPGACEGRG